MKRLLLLIVIMSFPVVAQAQEEWLYEYDWFLVELNMDGVSIEIPDNTEVGIVPALFFDFDPLEYFETTVCNVLTADFTADSEQITFSNIVISLDECTIAANTTFEFEYFPFFANHDGASFEYSIAIIDVPETGDQLLLFIENPDGDQAFYANKVLSTPENPTITFKVFPNPTQEKLSWNSPASGLIDARIYSMQGKLVQEFKQAQNSIDVSSLRSGMYFIELSDGKNLSRTKFIKR